MDGPALTGRPVLRAGLRLGASAPFVMVAPTTNFYRLVL